MSTKRTVNLITEAFSDEMSSRRKYELKNRNGETIVDLYFPPLTRHDRQRAQASAGTDEALTVSTQLLCQMAELEDGKKAFNLASPFWWGCANFVNKLFHIVLWRPEVR